MRYLEMTEQERKDRQYTAITLVLAIGISAGVLLGYFVYCVRLPAEGGLRFTQWLAHPISYHGLWWGLYGAAIAGASVYIKRVGLG